MVIALRDTSRPAAISYQGEVSFVLEPNEKTQLKGPASETHMNEGPSPGKRWAVSWFVYVDETDA